MNRKLLGELELSVGASAERKIQDWVAERRTPLNLSPGFLNRVVQSVHESAMRYLRPDAELTLGDIHLFIHVPRQIPNKAASAVASDHTIEFYLYVEGE